VEPKREGGRPHQEGRPVRRQARLRQHVPQRQRGACGRRLAQVPRRREVAVQPLVGARRVPVQLERGPPAARPL
jgi:hypothetical protein